MSQICTHVRSVRPYQVRMYLTYVTYMLLVAVFISNATDSVFLNVCRDTFID